MAVDLFCYVSSPTDEVAEVLESMQAKKQEYFLEKFLLSKASRSSELGKEAAREHGLTALSTFLIRVNDKSAMNKISDVVQIVKDAFGNSNVVILLENEERK